jgi:hypothetical protein
MMPTIAATGAVLVAFAHMTDVSTTFVLQDMAFRDLTNATKMEILVVRTTVSQIL